MRIRHFNTDLNGGAATSARRLHQSLLSQSIDSTFHYHPSHHDELATAPNRESFQSLSPVERTGFFRLFQKRRKRTQGRDYRNHFMNRPEDREIFSVPWQVDMTPFGKDSFCDVAHLHWFSSWLDLKSFVDSFPKRQPFVISLHDMSAITGGCHHADECRKFQSACSSCPQIDGSGPRDLSQRVFDYKKKIYGTRSIHFVAPSQWMENKVRESALGKVVSSVRTIRNPLDLGQFYSLSKEESRSSFQIPHDRTVIGFGASSLGNRRKGFFDLINALQILANEEPAINLTVLTFGVCDFELPKIPGVEFIALGFLPDLTQQQMAYSAMDLFALPSWAETISQTGVEAMACGVPVVGYDIGGIPEFVIPDQTGLLARHRDPIDLAKKLGIAINNLDMTKSWGENGCKFVGKEFSADVSRQKHLELYQSIV